MSINVTVKGNPVSIRHGKMVTKSGDNPKNEFDKRRRIRLEQVREQSKEIAKDVRDRVKKQQTKQISQQDRDGANKLKQWQTRKLLQLQEQYDECLKDIGLGHLQAEIENEEQEEAEAKKRFDKKLAAERGLRASLLMQAEKNKKNLEKVLPKQQQAKKDDNLRSKVVAKSPKKKPRTYETTESSFETDNNDVTINISGDNSEIPVLLNISSSSDSSEPLPRKQAQKSTTRQSKEYERLRAGNISPPTALSELSENEKSKAKQAKRGSRSQSISKDSQENKRTENDDFLKKGDATEGKRGSRSQSISRDLQENIPKNYEDLRRDFQYETRISDRIKRRYLPEPMAFDCFEHQPKIPQLEKITENQSRVSFSETMDTKKPCGCSKIDIPCKPNVYLQPISEENDNSSKGKAQSYDYSTRYSREFIPDPNIVQRIPESSVKLSDKNEPNTANLMKKRDQDAIKRGNKALERNQIQRDYQDLVKKLPVLKKHENIANIGKRSTDYHLSEERRQQAEKVKQNTMDNAYERAFPKPPEITLPKLAHPPKETSKKPYKIISGDEAGEPIAEWDVVNKKSTLERHENDLLALLEKLKEQREKLQQEVENIPDSSKFLKVLDEISNINQFKMMKDGERNRRTSADEEKGRRTSPVGQKTRRTSPVELKTRQTSPGKQKGKRTSQDEEKGRRMSGESKRTSKDSSPSKKVDENTNKRKYQPETTESSSSASIEIIKSPKHQEKKKKHSNKRTSENLPRPVLILQNISTQTSPKVSVSEKTSSQMDENTSKNKKIICKCGKKKTVSATSETTDDKSKFKSCNCEQIDKQELCEIIIKITEDQKPEVKILSPKKPKIIANVDKEQEGIELKFIEEPPKKDDKQEEVEVTEKPIEKREVKNKVSATKSKEKTQQKGLSKKPHRPSYFEKEQELVNALKPTSCGEYLQYKSNEDLQTTSTSYYSPPEPAPGKKIHQFSDWLKNIPKQGNLDESTPTTSNSLSSIKAVDPRLKIYIKKLLRMKRKEVGELSVTSSEVSSFSSSVFEVTGGVDATQQLNNVMRFFNLSPEDISKILNESEYTESSQSTLNKNLPMYTQSQEQIIEKSSVQPNYAEPRSQFRDDVQRDFFLKGMMQKRDKDDQKSTKNYTTVDPAVLSSILPEGSPTFLSNRENKTAISVPKNQSNPRDTSLKDYSCKNYRKVMEKYSDIAKNCYDRIQNLEKMILKIRQEKRDMLDNSKRSESDKENSTTAYRELPSHLGERSSSDDDTEQEKLTRDLLKIDIQLTEKLAHVQSIEKDDKKLTDSQKTEKTITIGSTEKEKRKSPETSKSPRKSSGKRSSKDSSQRSSNSKDSSPRKKDGQNESAKIAKEITKNIEAKLNKNLEERAHVAKDVQENLESSLDKNLVARYKDLLDPKKTTEPLPENTEIVGEIQKDGGEFEPFLVDIPKLPAFEDVEGKIEKRKAYITTQDNKDDVEGKIEKRTAYITTDPKGKRPPTTKRLENFSTEPHELSTIQEVDSKLIPKDTKLSDKSTTSDSSNSTELTKVDNSYSQSFSTSTTSDLSNILGELIKSAIKSAATIQTPRDKLPVKKSKSSPVKSLGHDKSPYESSSNNSELETVETMLKTLGMSWAISTLRKTQQALAHSSSSSSLDISVKKVDTTNTSQISLHGFLKKQVVLTSTSSDSEIMNLMKEVGDLSMFTPHTSQKLQRTSTPNQNSSTKTKSSSSKLEAMISGESDMSSIKQTEENFASVAGESNVSIDNQEQ